MKNLNEDQVAALEARRNEDEKTQKRLHDQMMEHSEIYEKTVAPELLGNDTGAEPKTEKTGKEKSNGKP